MQQPAQRPRVSGWKRLLLLLLVLCVGLAMLAVLGLGVVWKLYRMPASSMAPTLDAGALVMVDRLAYVRAPVARGDVVVFTPPHAPGQVWAKRVIGLPGDLIAFHGDVLSINGLPVQYDDLGPVVPGSDIRRLTERLPGRTHTVLEARDAAGPGGQGEWTVPLGRYFVMGDNRDNSDDSRFWSPETFLPHENVQGRAVRAWNPCAAPRCDDGSEPTLLGKHIQ